MSDIFISYASADRERARLLATALERRGWPAWWDRTIPPGKEYDQVIEEALDSAKCVIVLWSHASVASSWVKTEAAEAMQRKILVPALIDDVKIPLEFRRVQAADLSHWRGDPAGLEEFFQCIDLKIHGIEPGHDVKTAVPPPEEPRRPPVRPDRWTRAVWPAAALIVVLIGVSSGLAFWRSQQSDKPGPTLPATDVSAAKLAPAVELAVVDRPDSKSRPPAAPEPAAATRPPPISRRLPAPDPGKVIDRPVPLSRSPARDPDVVKTSPVDRSPVEGTAGTPATSPEPPTTPARETTPPARATPPPLPVEPPRQFEEILLTVTKDGETEEEDAILVFDAASLVVKDEDSKILRTLPYSSIQNATYSRTQRRIVFVRTTRHVLTLRVGREQVVLQLPGDTYLAVLAQIEKHTGLTIVH